MFQFPGLSQTAYIPILKPGLQLNVLRVSPFGNPRIIDCLRLPEAYRSLSRPSSTFGAKAFTTCTFQLNLILQSHRSAYLWNDAQKMSTSINTNSYANALNVFVSYF